MMNSSMVTQVMKDRFGSRGEWWVIAQFTLGPLVALATWLTRAQIGSVSILSLGLGLALAAVAAVFALGGIISLGRNLTAFPRPIDNGEMVSSGLYRVVRHPIYTGVILGGLAWALICSSLIGVVLSLLVFIFFDRKARREEIWLVERYAGYRAYQQRVKKLLPLIY
ncbi:MAG: methyltransferase family protein [Candidatus Roseilinea sp.]|uniref:methyltransferase family protein n=1 Tax=Candidatus Roseilinea sp. TaxID=2838777 RepID=UPI0040493E85